MEIALEQISPYIDPGDVITWVIIFAVGVWKLGPIYKKHVEELTRANIMTGVRIQIDMVMLKLLKDNNYDLELPQIAKNIYSKDQ